MLAASLLLLAPVQGLIRDRDLALMAQGLKPYKPYKP